MAVENVEINFQVNLGSLTTAIRNLKNADKEVKKLNSTNINFKINSKSLASADKAIDKFVKEAKKLKNISINFKMNSKSLTSADKAVDKLVKEIKNLKNINISFKVKGNIEAFQKELKELSKISLGRLSSEINKITQAFQRLSRNSNGLIRDITRISNINTNRLNNNLRNTDRALTEADKQTAKLYNQMIKLGRINMSDVPSKFRRIVEATNELTKNLSQADKASLRFYQDMVKAGRINLSQVPRQFREIIEQTNRAGNASDRLSTRIMNGMRRARSAIQSVSNGFASFGQSMMSAGQSMTNVGRIMTQRVTMPIVKGFGFSIKSAMDFEKQIAATGAVAGASKSEMTQLANQAKDLGIKTKYSAIDVAKGQYELLKAGRTTKQVFKEMKSTLDLAAAGDLEVGRAAEISSNMMNMFSKQGIKSSQVANLMAGAANQSAIDVGEFYNSMQYVGPLAATLNIPFKDVSSAIALLGNNAIKGSKAGTGLRQFLTRLQPQGKAAEEAMAQLGITTEDGGNKFFTSSGKVKSMSSMIDVLRDSTKGMTDQMKTDLLKKAFGLIASPTLLSLMKDESGALDEMSDRIGKITAADVAARKMDNFAGRLELLKSTVETLAIKIGNLFLPILGKLVGFVNKVVTAFSKLPNSVIVVGTVIAGLVAAIGPAVMMIGLIVTAVAGLAMVFSALLTPIGLVTAAVVTLIGAGALGGLVGLFAGLKFVNLDKLAKSFNGIKTKAQELLAYLQSQWKPAFDYVLSGDKKELGKIKDEGFRNSIKDLRKALIDVGKKINEFVEEINKAFGEIDEDKIDSISTAVGNLLTIFAKIAGVIVDVSKETTKWIEKFDKAGNIKNSLFGSGQDKDRANLNIAEDKKENLTEAVKTTKKNLRNAKTDVDKSDYEFELLNNEADLKEATKDLERQEKAYNKKYKKEQPKAKKETKSEKSKNISKMNKGITATENELSSQRAERKKLQVKFEAEPSLEKQDQIKTKIDKITKNIGKLIDTGDKQRATLKKKYNVKAEIDTINAQKKIRKDVADLDKSITEKKAIVKDLEIKKNANVSIKNKNEAYEKFKKESKALDKLIESRDKKAKKIDKKIDIDAKVNDSGAKAKIDKSTNDIKSKASKGVNGNKNVNVNANVNDSEAKNKINSSHSAMANIASKPISVFKSIMINASVDSSAAISSVSNAVNNIHKMAQNVNIPVGAKNVLTAMSQTISGTGSKSKKKTKKHALGTNYTESGMALVGEQGAELVKLPRGGQIYNSSKTHSILNNNGGNKNITINMQNTDIRNQLSRGLRMAGVY